MCIICIHVCVCVCMNMCTYVHSWRPEVNLVYCSLNPSFIFMRQHPLFMCSSPIRLHFITNEPWALSVPLHIPNIWIIRTYHHGWMFLNSVLGVIFKANILLGKPSPHTLSIYLFIYLLQPIKACHTLSAVHTPDQSKCTVDYCWHGCSLYD